MPLTVLHDVGLSGMMNVSRYGGGEPGSWPGLRARGAGRVGHAAYKGVSPLTLTHSEWDSFALVGW